MLLNYNIIKLDTNLFQVKIFYLIYDSALELMRADEVKNDSGSS